MQFRAKDAVAMVTAEGDGRCQRHRYVFLFSKAVQTIFSDFTYFTRQWQKQLHQTRLIGLLNSPITICIICIICPHICFAPTFALVEVQRYLDEPYTFPEGSTCIKTEPRLQFTPTFTSWQHEISTCQPHGSMETGLLQSWRQCSIEEVDWSPM